MGVETGVLAGWLGTAVLLGGAATAGAVAMSGGDKGSSSASATPSSAVSAPTGAEATEVEKARIRKKSKTLLSTLTGTETYGSAAPTLLGAGDTTKKTTLG